MSNTDFETPELEGLDGTAQIAVRLAQAGCQDSAIGFLVGKMKAEGYHHRVGSINDGIKHWKRQMSQCFVDQQKPQPGTFEHFRMRQELEAIAAKRLGRA